MKSICDLHTPSAASDGQYRPAELARLVGLHVCSMGERILRCETAPVVALTATMYATGNLS